MTTFNFYNKANNVKETYIPNNITSNKRFVNICKADQPTLKRRLVKELRSKLGRRNVFVGDGYIYGRGNVPVLVTAHMDTVHDVTCYEFHEEDGVIKSPQGIGGDDRCGIYMILELLRRGIKPFVLFCEDEEIGGVGSNKFCGTPYIEELKELKYFIELDRANANDAVYYDCGNEEFKNFISETIGYKEAYGSFSDISHLSPATDVASVNLSCGYYKAHTTDEYVVLSEMENTLNKVAILLMLDYSEIKGFDYQEEKYTKWLGRYSSYSSYYDDDYDEYFFRDIYGDDEDIKTHCFWVHYIPYREDGNMEIVYEEVETNSVNYEEAVGKFLMCHEMLCYTDIVDVELLD